jgi:uncharacterized zinc-type alcohol dehydrogenase-like protein
MALLYAVAFGAQVTVFDVTEEKRQDALDMGAVKYINITHPDDLKDLDGRFRVILNTIPASYDPAMYLRMLAIDGEMVVLGIPGREETASVAMSSLVMLPRRKLYGSQVGGMREMQEMLDYSVANGIYPRVEIIPIQELDGAFEKLKSGEVKYRYVIDMSTLAREKE